MDLAVAPAQFFDVVGSVDTEGASPTIDDVSSPWLWLPLF
jgi:hypothetical protein